MKNAWQAIVEGLQAQGVKYVFGMPGNPHLLYDALYDSDIKAIHAREQSSGVFMAMGYARAQLELGVCFGSTGPGFTNMVSGILEAQAASVPLLVLSAGVSTTFEGLPAFQETDQVAMAKPITKWAYRVLEPERIPWALRRAISIATTGCPGPVYLEIPSNLSTKKVNMPVYETYTAPLPPRAAAGAMEELVSLLSQAERPVIFAGGGAVWSGAFDQVRSLADDWGIPVLTTASGRGIIDENNPLALGLTGLYFTDLGREVYFDADLVLILGSRLDQFETGEWRYRPAGAKLIHVDIDPTAIGRNWIPDLGVVGDVKLVLEDLLAALEGQPKKWSDRAKAIADRKEAYLQKLAEDCLEKAQPLKTKSIIWSLGAVFGPKTVLVNENGSQDLWSYYSPYFRVPERGCIPPGAQTCMGLGVSGAIGVKLARPNEPVVCVTGDGAFQMFMRELPTAVQHNAPVTYIILNNKALGWIQYHQRQHHNRFICTDFTVQPDFAKIAEACGCFGRQVTTPEEVVPALEAAKAANDRGIPAVLDFIVDSEVAPGFDKFYQELHGY
ncbi:MAG: thiamine pyrophosphate-binding protein [Limnochordia bacterium]